MRNYMKVNWKNLVVASMCVCFIVCGVIFAEEVLGGGPGEGLSGTVEILEGSAAKSVSDAADASDEADTSNEDSVSIDLYEGPEGVASIRSMSFKEDTTIQKGLSALSQYFKKNIICSPSVTGTVSMTNLYDVSFEEALRAIIGPNKYDIQKDTGIVRVYTLDEYQKNKDLFESRVIPLYYITAAEAAKLITPLLSEFGSVASTTASVAGTTTGTGGDTVSICDTLVVQDMPDRVKNIEKKISEIDRMPAQVEIEVTILEAVLTETTQFGIDLDALGGLQTTAAGLTANGGIMSYSIPAALDTSTKGLDARILNDNLRVFIRALEEITDMTILANPKVLALNKQAGKIHIGNNNGYLTTTTVSDGGTATQEVEFLKTGTKLEFRPFICKDGMIRMEIYPEQSSGSVAETTGLPNSSVTTVQTNVMVKDGKTIVLGGLFQEKTTLTHSQVPLLGDIPVLGGLFKNVNDESIRTELIILITPHIINDPEETDGQRRMDDVNRLAARARKDLSWIGRARNAEVQYATALRYYDEGNKSMALCTLNSMWQHNRQYLEVDRLRERIIRETQPDYQDRIERIMLNIMNDQESNKWLRR